MARRALLDRQVVEGGAKGEKQFAISITGSTYLEPERLAVSPAWPDDKDSAGKQFLTDHNRSPSVVRLDCR